MNSNRKTPRNNIKFEGGCYILFECLESKLSAITDTRDAARA